MTHPRSIAAAQTIPVRGDVDANLERHLQLVRTAAKEEAQILVFPELSLTGYEMDLAHGLAFSTNDSRLGPLIEAAAAHSMTLIVGAPVRLNSRLYIGALIVSPEGAVDVYTKQRLGAFSESAGVDGIVPPGEATTFYPGDYNPLVRFGGHTAAIAVCADIGRPSHPEAAAKRGAKTYFASMFVIPSEFERDAANLETYAARHSMAVVFANYGGPSGGLASAGRSAVWSEKGERLVQLEANGAGVAVATQTDAGWRAKSIMLGEGT
jgi:predicted amidohydrolase